MYIKVKVSPNSKKEFFEKVNEDTFSVSVKEKAERNMANMRMLELLSQNLKIPIQNLKIITGHHTRNKILFVQGNQKI